MERKNNKKYGIFFLLASLLIPLSTILVYLQSGWFYPVRVLNVLLCLWLFYRFLRQRPENRDLALCTLLLVVVVADTAFSFRASSHGVEQSLSHQIWQARYWQTNAQGFRDVDLERRSTNGAILCIGDSYTAGYGIKDTSQRYSNLLQQFFPDREVYNLGIPGEGISRQLTIAEQYVKAGDIVIWQYFGDDIVGDESVLAELMKDSALVETFIKAVDPLGQKSIALQIPIRSTFILNYLYWNKVHPTVETGLIDALKYIYADDRYFDIHQAQILQFIHLCQEREAHLIAVIMPVLINEDVSDEIYEEKISSILSEENIPTLRVSQISRTLPISEKVVNRMDAHAGVLMHSLIAAALAEMLEKEEIAFNRKHSAHE